MNNNQILEKAIKKAVKNGYEPYYDDYEIFSHDFAKAFWGFKLIFFDETMEAEIYWRYHLQQMVLEEEPLQYLEKFL